MKETLAALTIPFGAWLVAAPWVDADPTTVGRVGGTVGGILLIAAAVTAMLRGAARWSLRLIGGVGAVLVGLGAVGAPAGLAVRLAAVLVGLVALGLSWFAAALPAPGHICAVNKGGGTLAEIKSLKVRDGKIAAPAILLGSMPETVYVTPQALLTALGTVNTDLVRALPGMVVTGLREARSTRTTVEPDPH